MKLTAAQCVCVFVCLCVYVCPISWSAGGNTLCTKSNSKENKAVAAGIASPKTVLSSIAV